ncbi:hypothetical protein HNP38_002128 [Chryseobacterium defluvii]|uniref:Uncharacterized protein n=1 Tax=Chryseobacterium defluvii TaxID=160396 RepID=A0A840KIX0_9FLAO|nr:hypothetical protein [Chryseobacterium defluvii]MBB4806832.1 hypothetical protein [Chryseobacterium defluvii]
MEIFNDEWSDDLSEFKILSFEEVSKGFEGNKSPLQGLSDKTFENMSVFKNSPFGQFWDKNIHDWAKEIFGNSKILDKRDITIADLSSKISHNQADFYNLLINKKNGKI